MRFRVEEVQFVVEQEFRADHELWTREANACTQSVCAKHHQLFLPTYWLTGLFALCQGGTAVGRAANGHRVPLRGTLARHSRRQSSCRKF